MSQIIGYVQGADFYLILSLLIFGSVFVISIIYAFTLSKKTLEELADLPFNQNKEKKNEKV